MSQTRDPKRPVGAASKRRHLAAAVGLCVGVLVSSCSTASNTTTTPSVGGSTANTSSSGSTAKTNCPGSSMINVVAAENFWGSIAAQLGGEYVTMTSLISNPDTDPHDYEATPQDGRAIANTKYVIENGVGYDPWVTKLADANPSSNRKILDIGSLLGLKDGDNPHRWYFPADVDRVIDQITADYKKIDPADAVCFDEINNDYKTVGLKQYKGLLDQIKQKYAGTPIGASESIVDGIADATGLKLITPPEYLNAISEGNDPTAQDKATVDAQINDKAIKVFVFNSQNSTPDVATLVDQAKTNGIPVSTVTETLAPANVTFQDWQSQQLQALLDALGGKSSG